MARFLVVDHDHSMVAGLTKLLAYDGHAVSSFTAGASAVEALSREPFDAVVTELTMPHVDGHVVVRAARHHRPHACVIVVSARARENATTLAEAGACIIADKPMAYDEVTEAIAQCRARGGPGSHGRCHLRSSELGAKVIELRRR
jgi:DNA-binding NtrC family response regulator